METHCLKDIYRQLSVEILCFVIPAWRVSFVCVCVLFSVWVYPTVSSCLAFSAVGKP